MLCAFADPESAEGIETEVDDGRCDITVTLTTKIWSAAGPEGPLRKVIRLAAV